MKPSYFEDGVFDADMSDLLGRVFTSVSATEDELALVCAEGAFRFFHSQDCCESVYIESIVGDLNDLVGEPIILAEETVSENESPEGRAIPEYSDESFTWTFYKLATRKGYVDIRWFGSSNGYYSESVEIRFTPSDEVTHNV